MDKIGVITNKTVFAFTDFIWDLMIKIDIKTIAAYSPKILTGLKPSSNTFLKKAPQKSAYAMIEMKKISQEFSQNSHFVSLI
jgi:hypothetical protein